MNADQITQPAAWPEGVIGRYLTDAGRALRRADITTDVIERSSTSYLAQCHSGCDFQYDHVYEANARKAAHAHAEQCRALPRPEVAQ
ncbi:hypothetical protein [Streptomyces mexicanus]|uniref:hypothetical protein n=1 Tax=Streptomyces mexicanus TaxID=178566 RepID=UPI00364D3AE1